MSIPVVRCTSCVTAAISSAAVASVRAPISEICARLTAPPTAREAYPSAGALEAGGEVPQRGRLVGHPQPAQLRAAPGDCGADLDHVVDVALGVGAARDREADEIHRRRLLPPV